MIIDTGVTESGSRRAKIKASRVTVTAAVGAVFACSALHPLLYLRFPPFSIDLVFLSFIGHMTAGYAYLTVGSIVMLAVCRWKPRLFRYFRAWALPVTIAAALAIAVVYGGGYRWLALSDPEGDGRLWVLIVLSLQASLPPAGLMLTRGAEKALATDPEQMKRE